MRVFISSTFGDMQAERDELVKHVFPQLRKLCESRGVTWGEVDLRWGITDEQKAEARVLPICLAEIHSCRPYFIGLLGDRYGWVPEDIAPELIRREAWLVAHRERSVTELEILHGALNKPATAHALFYFRDPAYIDRLPNDQQLALRERPTKEECARLGAVEAARRADGRRRKLLALKARIRASGLTVHEGYTDPRALGALVLADMTAIINRWFPEGSEPDPLDREAAEHEAFAERRAQVYIGRQASFDHLDAHARGNGPPWSSWVNRARESRRSWPTGPCDTEQACNRHKLPNRSHFGGSWRIGSDRRPDQGSQFCSCNTSSDPLLRAPIAQPCSGA